MASYIQRLAVILAAEHPTTGVYSADKKEVRLQLRAANVPDIQPLSMDGVREWASENARGFQIKQAIDDSTLSDQERNIAYILDKLLGTDDAQLDPDNPNHVSGINQLVSAGVITAADRTALIDAATVPVSILQKEGLAVPALCDIDKARA